MHAREPFDQSSPISRQHRDVGRRARRRIREDPSGNSSLRNEMHPPAAGDDAQETRERDGGRKHARENQLYAKQEIVVAVVYPNPKSSRIGEEGMEPGTVAKQDSSRPNERATRRKRWRAGPLTQEREMRDHNGHGDPQTR